VVDKGLKTIGNRKGRRFLKPPVPKKGSSRSNCLALFLYWIN